MAARTIPGSRSKAPNKKTMSCQVPVRLLESILPGSRATVFRKNSVDVNVAENDGRPILYR